MIKTRFISLLVLLAAVVTGAVAQTTYKVSVKEGTEDAASWTITPPEATTTGVAAGTEVKATYNGTKKVKSVKAKKKAAPAVWDGDLSKLTAESTAEFATATDGMTIKGALAVGVNVKVSIADGATVTLDGVTINGVNNGDNYQWAGINCIGDATIILSGTNTVKGFQENYPGVYVPSGNTLTINGTGSLTASSNGKGCGIGGGFDIACGNIVIAGGNITANGGMEAAGIGGGSMAGCGTISITGGTVTATGGEMGAGIGGGGDCSCGNITITGGTVNANGGWGAAGIGGGQGGSCGNVTITNGVTSVTATMCPGANYSIGCGIANDCGTVTIGCTLDGDGNPVGGTTGQISTSPYTYQPSN